MCIIIVTPIGTEAPLTTDKFERAAISNPHGMGLGWVEGGEVRTWKTMDNLDLLIRKYDAIYEKGLSNIITHFRIATQGKICLKNCHPFHVPNHNLIVAHNGTINICTNYKIDAAQRTQLFHSDTQIFVRDYLSQLPSQFWTINPLLRMMEKAVGYSKLVFLDSNNVMRWVNEKEGYWLDGHWFSNLSGIKNYQKKKKTNNKGKKTNGGIPHWLPASSKYADDVVVDDCPECLKTGILCGVCWYEQTSNTGWDNVTEMEETDDDKVIPFSLSSAKDWETALSWAFYLTQNKTTVLICIQCLATRADKGKHWDYSNLFPVYPDDIYALGLEKARCVDCKHNVFNQMELSKNELEGNV